MADIIIPGIPASALPLASSQGPGAVPHLPLTTTDQPTLPTAGEKTALATLASNGTDYLASGTIPAFVANAATIAPGTDKAAYYPIESTRTLAAASTLTLATTGSPPIGNYQIACHALALGYALTIANGGAAGGNLGSDFAASMTRAQIMHVWYDGTNWIFNGYAYIL